MKVGIIRLNRNTENRTNNLKICKNYLLHIPLIHITALLTNFLREGAIHQDWYVHAPFVSVPPEARWTLPLLYLVFAIDLAILYAACRWYSTYKFSHPEKKWLRYL